MCRTSILQLQPLRSARLVCRLVPQCVPIVMRGSFSLRKPDVVELSETVALVYNVSEKGMVHRLSRATENSDREKRRSRCGWRVGSATARVNFCFAKAWPPPCGPSRLCAKCFPGGSATQGKVRATGDDPIEDES